MPWNILLRVSSHFNNNNKTQQRIELYNLIDQYDPEIPYENKNIYFRMIDI